MTSLLCRLSEKDQKERMRIGRDSTLKEVVQWLEEQGIEATMQQVRYFLRKRGVLPRKQIINPKGSYAEKVITYIDKLLKLEGCTFTLWNLNLRGPSWSVVTKNLHADGLIESMGGNPRTRWKILVSKDEIQTWYEAEIKRASQHR